jgi:hypothetical protein
MNEAAGIETFYRQVSFDAPSRETSRSKYMLLKIMALAVDALLPFSATPMRR